MHPPNGVWVTSLTNQVETLEGADIILFDILTFIVLLLYDTYCSWSDIQSFNFVSFNCFPEDASIRYHWLTFEENGGSSTDQRSIYDEAVADNPTDVTSREPNIPSIDVKHISHGPIEGDNSAACVPHDSLGCTSGP